MSKLGVRLRGTIRPDAGLRRRAPRLPLRSRRRTGGATGAVVLIVLGVGTLGAFPPAPVRGHTTTAVVDAASVVTSPSPDVLDAVPALGALVLPEPAVAPTPLRAHAAEAVLQGRRLHSAETRAEAASLAADATCCIDDVRAAASYRARVTDVLVQRLLAEVAAE